MGTILYALPCTPYAWGPAPTMHLVSAHAEKIAVDVEAQLQTWGPLAWHVHNHTDLQLLQELSLGGICLSNIIS